MAVGGEVDGAAIGCVVDGAVFGEALDYFGVGEAEDVVAAGGDDGDLRIDRIEERARARGLAAVMRDFEDRGVDVDTVGNDGLLRAGFDVGREQEADFAPADADDS